MFPLRYLSPAAIGPVWPLMLVAAAFMAATTAFYLLARVRAWLQAFSTREYRFLQRLFDATEMFGTLAILGGMLGTCLGLLEVLPVLGASLQADGNADLLQKVLDPLRHVWASTVAGLLIGGLWSEVLLYLLKPYARTTQLPLSTGEPATDPPWLDETTDLAPAANEPPAADDSEADQDWRRDNHEGIY